MLRRFQAVIWSESELLRHRYASPRGLWIIYEHFNTQNELPKHIRIVPFESIALVFIWRLQNNRSWWSNPTDFCRASRASVGWPFCGWRRSTKRRQFKRRNIIFIWRWRLKMNIYQTNRKNIKFLIKISKNTVNSSIAVREYRFIKVSRLNACPKAELLTQAAYSWKPKLKLRSWSAFKSALFSHPTR